MAAEPVRYLSRADVEAVDLAGTEVIEILEGGLPGQAGR